MTIRSAGLLVLAVAAVLSACEREARRFQEPAPAAALPQREQSSQLAAGGSSPSSASTPPPYDENAYAISQGKRLFTWYNCVGCHARGGGGMGPPLMDDKWIYGAEPNNVFRTIVDGRPNGMPSFAGKMPEAHVWQLVAYVRSMSGLVARDAAPGRDDSLAAGEAENRREPAQPRTGGTQPPP
jgi:cytochrome c oxidase cbb3-type subunit III